MDEDGKKKVVFGSGNSCDLGKVGEEALIRWVEELYVRGGLQNGEISIQLQNL